MYTKNIYHNAIETEDELSIVIEDTNCSIFANSEEIASFPSSFESTNLNQEFITMRGAIFEPFEMEDPTE